MISWWTKTYWVTNPQGIIVVMHARLHQMNRNSFDQFCYLIVHQLMRNASSVQELGIAWTDRKRVKIKKSKSYFIGRRYRNFDELSLSADAHNVDWLPLYMLNNVHATTDFLYNTLQLWYCLTIKSLWSQWHHRQAYKSLQWCHCPPPTPPQYLINLSWGSCEFPNCWKPVKVTPLHKGGSTSDANNYHPLSVLLIFSEILVRVVHDQLSAHFDCHNILSDRQSEFGKGHSTGTRLIEFLENGRLSGVLFLDLKKAYDTVDHQILMSKLSQLGLSDNVI